ncbi:Transmembrane protein [Parasponia andersonii]|nr:Transmembrane protein [Parasponia andersonii]
MAGQENVKHLEECSVSNALGTWVFSVAGALLAIPVGIKRKSLAPLVFFGTTGTMLDIIMGISACEREHAERQMKLLEAQNSTSDGSITSESGPES